MGFSRRTLDLEVEDERIEPIDPAPPRGGCWVVRHSSPDFWRPAMTVRRRHRRFVSAIAVTVGFGSVLAAPAAAADVGVGPGGHVPGTSRAFTLVGHAPLAN